MAVLLPGKFIFLAQPHTGSSAMVLAFQDVFPEALDLRPHHMRLDDVKGKPGAVRMQQISRQRTRVWDHRPHKRRQGNPDLHVDPETVHKYVTGKEHVFTVIRNPYDFLVSCFVRQGRGKTFEDFVRGFKRSPYVEDGKLYYHAPDCHEVLRWEQLQEQLDNTMKKLGLSTFQLERHNETKDKKPWESYYTPKAFETVNERFGEELERFYLPRRE